MYVQSTGTSNTIGGITTGLGNVISGNSVRGVLISSDSNTVAGNIIGLNAIGNSAIANGVGLTIGSGANNIIGGNSAAARNIVSGNTLDGVTIIGATAAGNVIKGNYIGTDITGAIDLGNGSSGINISSSAGMNTIGGNTAGAGNVISGNTLYGINLAGNDQTVQGNIVGLNASGTAAIANASGIFVNSTTNLIGGSSALARNVISGNTNYGVVLQGDFNNVSGNYIGLNSAGTSAIGNAYGIYVTSSNNEIGGLSAGLRNVISGNTSHGVYINDQAIS